MKSKIVAALMLTLVSGCASDHPAGSMRHGTCAMMRHAPEGADGKARDHAGCAMMQKKPAADASSAHQHPAP